MLNYFIFSSIGGKPNGKTFSQYLTQISNGLFGLTTFVLVISIIVLLYQAMKAKSSGDQTTYQDKMQKIGLVLILAIVAVATKGALS